MMKAKFLFLAIILFVLTVLAGGCTAAATETPLPDETAASAVSSTTTPFSTQQPTSMATPKPTSAPTAIPTTQPDLSYQEGGEQTTPPDPSPTPSPSMTAAPSSTPKGTVEPHEPGTVRVRPGDTLNSKIVPRICDAFGMSKSDVKNVLENCRASKLINPALDDFRRMEGIILPGTYDIGENDTLEDIVNLWIDQAEARYDATVASCSNPNDLTPYEALSLAAVVEWECLPNNTYEEVAAAFLNRINDGSKLRSCATTEYALGYLRPFLTSSDIKVSSDYNTYYTRGVPIGPICALEDDCLRVSVAESVDTSLYYFFNDYALREMLVFSSYDDFKDAAAVSRDLFDETFDIDPYEKVDDKKALFGYPQ